MAAYQLIKSGFYPEKVECKACDADLQQSDWLYLMPVVANMTHETQDTVCAVTDAGYVHGNWIYDSFGEWKLLDNPDHAYDFKFYMTTSYHVNFGVVLHLYGRVEK